MHAGEVIRAYREARGWSLGRLESESGVDRGNLSRFENGKAGLRDDSLEKVCAALGLKPWQVFFEAEEGRRPLSEHAEDEMGRTYEPSKYAFVAKYNIPFHGGPGGQAPSVEEVEDHLAFRSDWLREKGLKAESLVIVPVKGESMAPLISEGDIVLVNTADKNLESGRIYCIDYDDDLRVKRLYRELDGSITISSDNKSDPKNRDENIPAGKLEALLLRIIGRVVWAGGDL